MLDDELLRKQIRMAGPAEQTVEDDYVGSDMQESEEPDESFWNSELDESSLEVEPISEAQAIRDYLAQHPEARNVDVVKALAEQGIKISSSQVSRQKKNLAENA